MTIKSKNPYLRYEFVEREEQWERQCGEWEWVAMWWVRVRGNVVSEAVSKWGWVLQVRGNVVSEGWFYVYKILWTTCVYKIFPSRTWVYKTRVLCKFKNNIEFLILDIYEYKMFFLKKIESLRLRIYVAFSLDQQLHSKCNAKFWTVGI